MMTKKDIRLNTPLTTEALKKLRAGDMVLLSGTVYGARDMAHKRMVRSIQKKEPLPLDLDQATLFYVGPSPTPPGKKSGSVGPTTAARMDRLTEPLLKQGVKAMIGKGARGNGLKDALQTYGAVYLIAIGGIAAYLSTKIKKIEQIAYPDLGAEALYRLDLEDFPLFVAYDLYGGDIFARARRKQ